MPIILNAALAEQKKEYTLNERMWFFGPYASTPQHFSYPPGELKAVFALARYVKQMVDESNDDCEALNHFANASIIAKKGLSYDENMTPSVFSLVFGSLREKKLSQQTDSLEAKKKDLFEKANEMFQQFERKNDILPIQQFTMELVEVSFKNPKWKGKVRCIFCKPNDLSGDVRVYLKLPAYWVLANLNTHINRFHVDSNKENQCGQTIKLEISHVEDGSKDDDQTDTVTNKMDDATNSIEEATNCIEDLSAVSIEDALYGQLFSQCIRMTNCILANLDKVQIKTFGLRPASSRVERTVKYCKMRANGDCFFLSVAHQLFNMKVDSKEHEERALELRKSLVTYIKQVENFPRFLFDLKNRIKCDKKAEDSKITEMCAEFMDELLMPGTWAGMESFNAICEMENANIVVINDDGMGYSPGYLNRKANKSLLLLFSSSNSKLCKNNLGRSHYDSVTAIHKKKISQIARQISEKENHHDEFVKEAPNRSIISLD